MTNVVSTSAGAFSIPLALQALGYSKLNPMQQKAVDAGILGTSNFVVSAPTASGKTLLAFLKINAELESGCRQAGKKIVYIVPLRALAAEKYEELQQVFQGRAAVALSTGDYDASRDSLFSSDVLVVTSEKMDSLLRHSPKFAEKIALAIADEVHLLDDEQRGATLEVVLTKLLRRGTKLLCLSATVPNAKEVASWLGAKLFSSEWRATPLEKKICAGGKLFSEEGIEEVSEKRAVGELVAKALAENSGKGQAIIFVSTRRSTESVAGDIAATVEGLLSPQEKADCAALSKKALRALSTPTSQCKALSECLASGVAFHHAGLVEKDRRIVEEGFKKLRCVKCVVATTTLAMGIDYPASWVIVRDLKRFDGDFSSFIPNLECQQMLGRAGRPRYDKRGVGVMVCQTRDLAQVRDKYILGPLEDLYSKLSSEPSLRMHALSLVASGECGSFSELQNFFASTFFASQYGAGAQFSAKIERAVLQLMEFNFIREKNNVLLATPVGRRVSELYLDPLTAHSFVKWIAANSPNLQSPDFAIEQNAAKETTEDNRRIAGAFDEFSIARKQVSLSELRAPVMRMPNAVAKPADGGPAPAFRMLLEFAGASESRPLARVSRNEEQALWDELFGQLDEQSMRAWEMDFDALSKYKGAKITNAWINEQGEEAVLQQFDLPPGILHARVRIQEWLAYSMAELAFVLNAGSVRLEARKLQKRLKYGVKEELLDLVRMRGVGRVRARKLFLSGLKNREQVRAAGEKLSAILGSKVAEKLLEQEKQGFLVEK